MSDQAIDAAVEKILSEPEFAARVYTNPEQALTSQFDLAPGEWRSIAWSLQQDVQGSLGDTQGYQLEGLTNQFRLGGIRFDWMRQVPTFKSNFDRASEDPTAHASGLTGLEG